MSHSRLSPLCFDRLLDRKSAATISIHELHQLYHQLRTKKERDQCFNPKIMDRLITRNFNNVVHLNTNPENDEFFANDKILHSLKGIIFIDDESQNFSKNFYHKFLSLIGKIEGDLFLIFHDVEEARNKYVKRCAQTLSRKRKCGGKVFLIDISNTRCRIGYETLARKIFSACMDNDEDIIYYKRTTINTNNQLREHQLSLKKINGGATIEKLYGMIHKVEDKQLTRCLENLLPLVKAAELPGGGRDIQCWFNHGYTCGGRERSGGDYISIYVNEPRWFYCEGCVLKINYIP